MIRQPGSINPRWWFTQLLDILVTSQGGGYGGGYNNEIPLQYMQEVQVDLVVVVVEVAGPGPNPGSRWTGQSPNSTITH